MTPGDLDSPREDSEEGLEVMDRSLSEAVIALRFVLDLKGSCGGRDQLEQDGPEGPGCFGSSFSFSGTGTWLLCVLGLLYEGTSLLSTICSFAS